MSGDLLPAAVISVIFIALFAGGEAVRRIRPDTPELSRKFVHCAGGITALSFPYVLSSPWTVILLAAVFAGIIALSRRLGLLRSVHGVDRKTSGAVYFPLAIAILFLVGHDHKPFYVISMLVLTVSDTLAALAGSRYGSIAYDVEDSYRTLEGSLVFFFVTFLCIHLPLLLMTDIPRLQSVLVALIIALLVTGFEAVSLAGSDNLFVPLGTYFILTKMMRHDLAFTVEQTIILFAIIAITVALSFVQKVFKPSGLIGMILVNYSAWSLCNVYWFVPLLLAQLLLFAIVYSFRQRVPEDITNYQVKVLFFTASVPVLFIFAANATDDYVRLYLPYLTAIVSQIALIFSHFLSLVPAGRGLGRLSGPAAVLASTAVIALVPILVYVDTPFLTAAGLVLAGAVSGEQLFRGLVARYAGDSRIWLMRQRFRMLCSSLAAGVVFLLQSLSG